MSEFLTKMVPILCFNSSIWIFDLKCFISKIDNLHSHLTLYMWIINVHTYNSKSVIFIFSNAQKIQLNLISIQSLFDILNDSIVSLKILKLFANELGASSDQMTLEHWANISHYYTKYSGKILLQDYLQIWYAWTEWWKLPRSFQHHTQNYQIYHSPTPRFIQFASISSVVFIERINASKIKKCFFDQLIFRSIA